MMTRSSTPSPTHSKRRSRSPLSAGLEKNLSSYALAAGSAGVALLACAQAADAKVVITKVDITVPDNGVPVQFDFNDELRVVPAQSANEVWQAGTSWGYNCAAKLGRGTRIDRLRPFAAGIQVMYGDVGSSEGIQVCPWRASTPAKPYLGVKFLDKEGALHYGWVRVTNNFVFATITGYAYETIPNKPILAGAINETGDETSLLEPSNLHPKGAQPA